MNWQFWKRFIEWEIQPIDIRWVGGEAALLIFDGWEPFGVSEVPNTTNPNQVRVWRKRRKKFRKHLRYEVRIQSAGWGGHEVLLHLTGGWEPFGLSISPPDQPIVWFKRRA